jgi:ELWxxDGT repeat protein
VKDLNPGPGDGAPYDMTDVGGTAFFQAYRPDTGVELSASDGTEAGTRLVRDLNPGPDGSSPYDFTDLGGVAFFVASTADGGSALWKSGGTEAGTQVVRAFASAWQSSPPRDLTVAGGRLWFLAPVDDGSEEIWSTDGTGGAELFPHLSGAALVRAGDLGAVGDMLFFTTYDLRQARAPEDGRHARGTSRIGSFKGFVTPRFAAAGSLLYFRAEEYYLWRTDGTAAGTVMLSSGNPDELTAVRDLLYFTASDAEHGRELWRSDGTPLGTLLVKDIDPGPADGLGGRLTNVDGTLVGPSHHTYRQGPDGTVLVRHRPPTSLCRRFQAVGGLFTPAPDPELRQQPAERRTTENAGATSTHAQQLPESPATSAHALSTPTTVDRVRELWWCRRETRR